MKNECVSPEYFSAADASTASALKIVVIYEDFASGKRAKHFAERLAEQHGCACRLTESLWRSDLLEYPPIAAEVAREATGCDYLIVALHADRVLPLAVQLWIEAQLDTARQHGTGLVVLLDSVGENPGGKDAGAGGARRHLRARCAKKDVPFFCHAGAAPTDEVVASLRRWEETPVTTQGRWPGTQSLCSASPAQPSTS